jgi:cytoskeletal protein RodZ
MSPEERKMLQDTLDLSRENNEILRKMRRGQFVANIIHSLKWIVLIIITIWSWLLIQPYFERMMDMYSQVQEATQSVNELKVKTDSAIDASGLQNLLETFRIGTQ